MKKKVVSSLVLTGAMAVMAPQVWAQAGEASGSGSAVGSSGATQTERPTDPSVSGQSEHSPGTSGAQSGMEGQHMAGQQLSQEKIKEIQEALKEKGQYQGEVDGVFGATTQQALREFQQKENLQVTGRVDKETAQALGVEIEGAESGAVPGASGSGMGTSSEGSPGAGSGASEPTEPGTGMGTGSGSSATGESGSSGGTYK